MTIFAANPGFLTSGLTGGSLIERTSPNELIKLFGKKFITHSSGALFWPDENCLIISDLYLRSGPSWVPTNDIRPHPPCSQVAACLTLIEETLAHFKPGKLIVLGRSFRRSDDPYHIAKDDLARLRQFQQQVDWHWVAGTMARDLPGFIGGKVYKSLRLAGIHFRAAPFTGPVCHEIAGGMLPMARYRSEREIQSDACYASDGRRLVMPAFGGTAAKTNVLDDKFLPIFGHNGLYIHIISYNRTYSLAASQLKSSKAS